MALTRATFPRYGTQDDYLSREILERLAKDAPNMRDIKPDANGNYGPGIMRMAAKGVNFIRVPSGTFLVGDCKLTKPMMFLGDGVEGIDPVAATFVKPSTASYCISFDSTGYTRPQGGGIRHVHVRGQTSTDTGDLVIGKTWSYLRFEYCGFHNLKGTALNLRDVAESKINDNLFRRIGDTNGQVILMGDYVGSVLFNVNNLHITDNTFGLCSGAWLRATNQANVDMLWFTDNKVEWDSNPAGANTEGQYVLDLGQVSRAWILDNGFTHFRDDATHNLYEGVLRMGAASGYSVVFEGNKLFGCRGYIFDVQGGSLIARNNESNQADSGGTVSWRNVSTKVCKIEAPIQVQSNGNQISTAFPKGPTFIPSGSMGGTVGNQFSVDTDSTSGVVMQVPSATEIRRITVPEDMYTGNDGIRVVARVKSVGGQSTVRLNTNGTLDVGSLSTGVADTWVNLTFVIPSGQIGAGSIRLHNDGPSVLLFDGIQLERADYMDVSFAWTPGEIAAGAKAVSPSQGFVQNFIDPGSTIKGYSVPNFDAGIGDLEVGIRPRNASGNWEVTLRNNTAAPITPGITRCRVRLFL